jgi:hypothetical protein
MVGIDQPWQHHVPAQVKHLISLIGKFPGRSRLLNETIANKKTAIKNLPAMVIHGYQNVRVTDQKSGHAASLIEQTCLTTYSLTKKEENVNCLTN